MTCKFTIIGSDNGLSPGRRQAIIWNNDGLMSIGALGTNFSEILIEIHTFSFTKMHLKVLSAKWRPCCLDLNVLTKDRKQAQIIRQQNADLTCTGIAILFKISTHNLCLQCESFLICASMWSYDIASNTNVIITSVEQWLWHCRLKIRKYLTLFIIYWLESRYSMYHGRNRNHTSTGVIDELTLGTHSRQTHLVKTCDFW